MRLKCQAGHKTASFCTICGKIIKGIHSPDRIDIGRYTRLTTAAADCPFTSVPISRPSAQNGRVPTSSEPVSFNQVSGEICTPPKPIAAVLSSRTMTRANTWLIASLAKKYAPVGIGETRLSSSQPCCRSIASPTPKPNRAGPITPNTP